jgi:hypothetical protein
MTIPILPMVVRDIAAIVTIAKIVLVFIGVQRAL